MRYLSVSGAPRGFRALFGGGDFYCPEKIESLDDEILIEKSFSQRLHAFLSPYFDGDMRLHQCLPAVSKNIGAVSALDEKCALFTPRTHNLELAFRLNAALLDTFHPELLQKPLHYFAFSMGEAAAFCAGFPMEQKSIYLPEGIAAPQAGEEAAFFSLPPLPPKDEAALRDKFSVRLALRLDGMNILRLFGLSALILHAVFLAGEQKLWFYGDEFNLAVPADNLEMLTAAYYLARSGLPIRKILAVSSQNRIVYNFLSKGSFNPSVSPCDMAFYASLYRILYEISKGTMPKVAGWQENLRRTGAFAIDSGSLAALHKKIEPHFAGRNLLEGETPQKLSKTAHAAFTLSQGYQIPTIIIDEDPAASPEGEAPAKLSLDELMPRLH